MRTRPRLPQLLRDRTFRRFWLGQTVSLFGDQVSLFAIPLVAVLILHAHPAEMGYLTAAGVVPSLLFSLHAGAWVDRQGHRRITMLAADLARAGLLVTVPVTYALGVLTLAQLYAVTFSMGFFDVLFFVSYSTLFVSIVKPDDYLQGNSLYQKPSPGEVARLRKDRRPSCRPALHGRLPSPALREARAWATTQGSRSIAHYRCAGISHQLWDSLASR